jgi:hypothetical protein
MFIGFPYYDRQVYDAVYLLRALIAIVAGVVFGAWGLQGLPYFIGYLALSFVGEPSIAFLCPSLVSPPLHSFVLRW